MGSPNKFRGWNAPGTDSDISRPGEEEVPQCPQLCLKQLILVKVVVSSFLRIDNSAKE